MLKETDGWMANRAAGAEARMCARVTAAAAGEGESTFYIVPIA